MTDLSATIWRPNIGEGEMSANGGLLIITKDNLIITTISEKKIITDISTYTELPATEWIESDGE